jgi:hypothetical protein
MFQYKKLLLATLPFIFTANVMANTIKTEELHANTIKSWELENVNSIWVIKALNVDVEIDFYVNPNEDTVQVTCGNNDSFTVEANTHKTCKLHGVRSQDRTVIINIPSRYFAHGSSGTYEGTVSK